VNSFLVFPFYIYIFCNASLKKYERFPQQTHIHEKSKRFPEKQRFLETQPPLIPPYQGGRRTLSGKAAVLGIYQTHVFVTSISGWRKTERYGRHNLEDCATPRATVYGRHTLEDCATPRAII